MSSPSPLLDVLVVGGGAAGLAGAKTLLRSRRSVVVLDAGDPRNAPADGVHNLLGLEGISPAELLERGRAEVAAYGGTVRRAHAVAARHEAGPDGEHFVVTTGAGEDLRARRLLVTTGLVDDLPDVPGLAERWGSTVLHCPFCHGWEVRDQRLVVLATGPAAVHQGLMFAALSDDVTVLTHDAPPDAAGRAQLQAAGVQVREGRAVALEGEPLTGVRLEDGDVVAADAVVVAPWLRAASPVLDALGLVAVEHPSGMGEHYPSEAMGETSVPGLRVAGNVTDVAGQVAGAASAGALAGAALHGDLLQADLLVRPTAG